MQLQLVYLFNSKCIQVKSPSAIAFGRLGPSFWLQPRDSISESVPSFHLPFFPSVQWSLEMGLLLRELSWCQPVPWFLAITLWRILKG